MATSQLINLCKRFVHGDTSGIEDVVNPFAAVTRVMKRVRQDFTGTGPKRPFIMENLTLTIPDGKTMVILGPSGCGKSTLLRLISGLMPPDAGEE